MRPPIASEQPYQEPIYREHVSGPLGVHPHALPSFYPPDLPKQPEQVQYAPLPQKPVRPQGEQQLPPAVQPAPVQPPPAQQYPPAYQQGYAPYGYQAPAGYVQPAYGYAAGYGYAPYYHPSYPYPYNQYPYPYNQYPVKPRRDTYLFVMSIIATACSGLVLATGFLCSIILMLTLIMTPSAGAANAKQASQLFGGVVMFTALTLAGLLGGSFSLFHSIRSLMRRRSREFKLPWFWIFLGLYVLLLVIGLMTRGSAQIVNNTGLVLLLIGLAGLLPALTILALALRRIHYPRKAPWPTTWRRFTVALVSGATSAILFAGIFELILDLIVQRGLHISSFNLSDPNMQIPNDPRLLLYMFLLVSVTAPLVEEGVKPLAVIALIGRINSAAEAFILGLACGIGFDLIETSGYISMGYRNWVDVAIERSSAGLRLGFGAGMVALGWYYLTHKHATVRYRILVALSSICYAVLQHAIWNGSFVFQLLPPPIGPYLDQGTITIGNYPLSAGLLVYLTETILMLIFFLYVTGRLRGKTKDKGGKTAELQQKDGTAEKKVQPVASLKQEYPQPVR